MKVLEMYELYPYEKYGEVCFKRLRWRFRIRKDSYLYDECYSIAMKVYLYTMCRCSLKNHTPALINAYLYKVMGIFIICVINTYDERKNICVLNNLRSVDIDGYRV